MNETKTSESNTLCQVGAKVSSPLQGSINEQGEQLEKLTSLVYLVKERLSPILNNYPKEYDAAEQVDSPPVSEIRGQVIRQIGMVKSLQYSINLMLESLEV